MISSRACVTSSGAHVSSHVTSSGAGSELI